MRRPWHRKEKFYRSIEIVEPVVFDLILTRTSSGYMSQWRIDNLPQSSKGAVALAEELAKALPEVMRRANRKAPGRPEVIHLKMGMY